MDVATPKEREEMIDAVWQKLKDNKTLTSEEKDKYASMLELLEKKP